MQAITEGEKKNNNNSTPPTGRSTFCMNLHLHWEKTCFNINLENYLYKTILLLAIDSPVDLPPPPPDLPEPLDLHSLAKCPFFPHL